MYGQKAPFAVLLAGLLVASCLGPAVSYELIDVEEMLMEAEDFGRSLLQAAGAHCTRTAMLELFQHGSMVQTYSACMAASRELYVGFAYACIAQGPVTHVRSCCYLGNALKSQASWVDR